MFNPAEAGLESDCILLYRQPVKVPTNIPANAVAMNEAANKRRISFSKAKLMQARIRGTEVIGSVVSVRRTPKLDLKGKGKRANPPALPNSGLNLIGANHRCLAIGISAKLVLMSSDD